MPSLITDEIIDAIIQNERRHVCRAVTPHPSARALQETRNLALLRPDWTQLPPGWAEDAQPAPARKEKA